MHQMLPATMQSGGKMPMCVSTSMGSNAMKAWVGFSALGLWIFHVIAEGEVTSILTLSVFAQALSFILLWMQIAVAGSVAGISGKALIMQAIKLCCRLGTTLWLDGYLPMDRSGDWIYQVGDVVSLLMVLQIIFLTLVSHKSSYQSDVDSLDLRNLVMGAVVLAVLIHPCQHGYPPLDILWTTHLYVDAIAMVPQLWMISKAGGKVNGLTAHYIAATLLSNVLSGVFWFLASSSLAVEDGNLNMGSLAVNGAHVVQLFLLLDFGYFYVKACVKGSCSGVGQAVFDL